jgi:hypothetical protein
VRRKRSQGQLLEKWLGDYRRLGRGRNARLPGRKSRWRRWKVGFADRPGAVETPSLTAEPAPFEFETPSAPASRTFGHVFKGPASRAPTDG